MGLIAATITKQSMIAYKNELEYKIMLIEQAKLGLAESVKDLQNAGLDYDPESPVVKQLEQRKARLNQLEKKLDMQLSEYQIQLKMVGSNMSLADSQISSAVKG